MTDIMIKVAGASATRVSQTGILTTGMVGATVTFSFDGLWDELSKTAVFRCHGVTRDQLQWDGLTVQIPPEVLVAAGELYVGVEGRNGDGSLVIPTVWARAGNVHDGANASGDPSTEPGLPVWAQIQAMIGELDKLETVDKSCLVAAINEALTKSGGTVDEAEVQRIVDAYLAEHPAEVTETDPTVPDWAKQSTKPSYTAEEVGAVKSPDTAAVGQTIMVKEVDESGKPTSWECVDVAGGGSYVLLNDIVLTEAVSSVEVTQADDGTPYNLRAIYLEVGFAEIETEYGAIQYTDNNVSATVLNVVLLSRTAHFKASERYGMNQAECWWSATSGAARSEYKTDIPTKANTTPFQNITGIKLKTSQLVKFKIKVWGVIA